MLNISKCSSNDLCEIKYNCYRYTAPDSEYWQSYTIFNTHIVKKKKDCEGFWDNKKYRNN